MKVEHKLSPTVVIYAQKALAQLRDLRMQYLAALGQAKEMEMQSAIVRVALEQQLAIVEHAEQLPASPQGYALSQDGTTLIGETAPVAAPYAPVGGVNGNG